MKNFTSKSQKIGELGEDIACKFLENHGFSILERNYTKKWGEIDVIAEKGNKRYFIEVKAKSVSRLPEINTYVSKDSPRERTFGVSYETFKPEENMHIWKLKRLRRVVETYLISKRMGNIDWQFDLLVVYIDLEKRVSRVKVLDNIIL